MTDDLTKKTDWDRKTTVTDAADSVDRIALRATLVENAKLSAEVANLRDRVRELQNEIEDHECVCDHDSGIEPDVLESATVIELKEQAARLQRLLDAERRSHDELRDKHRAFERDYRAQAQELHGMRDPMRREGRERELLTQIGVLQTQVFEWQAKHRNVQSSLERSLGPHAGQAMRLQARYDALTAAGEAGVSPALINPAVLTLPAEQRLAPSLPAPKDYYERMREEVNNSRATTVAELKRKVIGMLSDALDELSDEEL